jgi:signal transduction histidine kinase
MDVNALDAVNEAVVGVATDVDIEVTADEDPRAFADAFHVRQVVSNLVTNALRHGASPVQIHVENRDGETVTITVSDHGTGVPPDQVETLFDRFGGCTSGQQPDGNDASTGFGLYIAAGLAAANHGSLSYDGSETGARFCLSLPRPGAPGTHELPVIR